MVHSQQVTSLSSHARARPTEQHSSGLSFAKTTKLPSLFGSVAPTTRTQSKFSHPRKSDELWLWRSGWIFVFAPSDTHTRAFSFSVSLQCATKRARCECRRATETDDLLLTARPLVKSDSSLAEHYFDNPLICEFDQTSPLFFPLVPSKTIVYLLFQLSCPMLRCTMMFRFFSSFVACMSGVIELGSFRFDISFVSKQWKSVDNSKCHFLAVSENKRSRFVFVANCRYAKRVEKHWFAHVVIADSQLCLSRGGYRSGSRRRLVEATKNNNDTR